MNVFSLVTFRKITLRQIECDEFISNKCRKTIHNYWRFSTIKMYTSRQQTKNVEKRTINNSNSTITVKQLQYLKLTYK